LTYVVDDTTRIAATMGYELLGYDPPTVAEAETSQTQTQSQT